MEIANEGLLEMLKTIQNQAREQKNNSTFQLYFRNGTVTFFKNEDMPQKLIIIPHDSDDAYFSEAFIVTSIVYGDNEAISNTKILSSEDILNYYGIDMDACIGDGKGDDDGRDIEGFMNCSKFLQREDVYCAIKDAIEENDKLVYDTMIEGIAGEFFGLNNFVE